MLDPATFDTMTPRPRRRWVAGLLAVVIILVAWPLGKVIYLALFPGPGYAFLQTQPGLDLPVAYNPCLPIEFVVYHDPAPAGTEGILDDAIEVVAEATGLTFTYLGPAENPAAQTRREPDARGEPVLIGWATPQDVEQLEDAAGIGGSSSTAWNAERGEFEYVTGNVILNASALAETLERPDGRAHVRGVIIHELGHLLGLDHVRDPEQIMHDRNVGQTELAEGDRAGLAAVGAGRCAAPGVS